jgi:hypothetical protein
VIGLKTLDHHIPAVSKSMSFQGKLFINGRVEPIAILDEVTVTVTKLAHPQTGAKFLLKSLSYLATSDGFRTAETTAEWPPPNAFVHFKNASGGIMHVWPLSYFELKCGWNKEFRVFGPQVEHTSVDWFDLWAGVQHPSSAASPRRQRAYLPGRLRAEVSRVERPLATTDI